MAADNNRIQWAVTLGLQFGVLLKAACLGLARKVVKLFVNRRQLPHASKHDAVLGTELVANHNKLRHNLRLTNTARTLHQQDATLYASQCRHNLLLLFSKLLQHQLNLVFHFIFAVSSLYLGEEVDGVKVTQVVGKQQLCLACEAVFTLIKVVQGINRPLDTNTRLVLLHKGVDAR